MPRIDKASGLCTLASMASDGRRKCGASAFAKSVAIALIGPIACVAMALLAPCRAHAQPGTPSGVTLSIVSTNDVHGRIQQLPLLGGYLRNLRAARAQDGGAVLLLDAGDMFQGTLESNTNEGAAMVRAYRALEYTAVTLGNHEFDFGPVGPHAIPSHDGEDPLGALKARVAQASFPFLNANLQGPEGQLLGIPKLKPAILVRPRGIPVGIVGGVTADVLRTTHAANTHGIHVLPLASAIAEQARALRAQGARLVIALVHAGGDCRELQVPDDLSSCVADAEGFALARALPPGSVDIIVGGHTHAGMAQRVNGIALIEAFSNGLAFGRVDVRVPAAPAPRTAESSPVEVRIYPPQRLCVEDLSKPSCVAGATYEGRPVVRDAWVARAIAADLRRARIEREQLLGVEIVSPITREHKAESPLNNLVADLMLSASPGADAAFNNAGGIRIPLPKGPLRYGTLFEMFPFDNTLAILNISARQLASILAHNLEASNGILALAGLRAAASCVQGGLTVQLFDRAGQIVPPDRPLTVVTSDFLARSGDGAMSGQTLAPDAITIVPDRLMRDVLRDGFVTLPNGQIDGSDKRLFDPEQPRVRYPGRRPVQCTSEQLAE